MSCFSNRQMTLEFNKNIRTFPKENERVFNCNIISSIQRAIDRDEQKLNAKKAKIEKKTESSLWVSNSRICHCIGDTQRCTEFICSTSDWILKEVFTTKCAKTRNVWQCSPLQKQIQMYINKQNAVVEMLECMTKTRCLFHWKRATTENNSQSISY